MIINVFLTAFQGGQIRQVEMPDIECTGSTNRILEIIYSYGQNEAQPQKDRCSISPGDVIELRGRLYMILMVGFTETTKDNIEKFKKLNPTDKMKYLMGMEEKNENEAPAVRASLCPRKR
jgi:hypothetical protein